MVPLDHTRKLIRNSLHHTLELLLRSRDYTLSMNVTPHKLWVMLHPNLEILEEFRTSPQVRGKSLLPINCARGFSHIIRETPCPEQERNMNTAFLSSVCNMRDALDTALCLHFRGTTYPHTMRKLSQRAFAATFEFRIEDRQSFVNEKRAFAPNQNPSLMSMN